MKNLKRALSFALASVMVIGMMVVGAGAADFTDADKIVNDEAVNTLVALNILNGKGDGSYFDPTATVTRGEMAKMITVALNGGKAPVIGTKPVPTYADIDGHWAEAYIEYCSNLGIIAGYDGKFRPDDVVTGTEAAKMMLVAQGWDAKIFGFTGNDWALNVNTEANKVDLYEGLETIDPSAGLSRDNAAQLVFNGVLAPMMVKSPNMTITNGNITWDYTLCDGITAAKQTIFSTKYDGKVWIGNFDGNYNTGDCAKEGYIQSTGKLEDGTVTGSPDFESDLDIKYIGEEIKVLFKDGKTTANDGKPTSDDTIYGVFVTGATEVLTATLDDISTTYATPNKIKVAGVEYKVYNASTDTVVYNYDPANANAYTTNTYSLAGDAKTAFQTGIAKQKGDTIKFLFNNDGEIYKAYVTESKLEYVTAVNSEKVTITGISAIKLADHNVYEGIAKDDVVVVTALYAGDKTVYTVEKAKVVSGTVNGYKAKDNVVVDGTTYEIYNKANLKALGFTTAEVSFFTTGNIDETFDLYMVNGKVAAAVKTSASANNYSLVIDKDPYGIMGDAWNPYKVVVLGADGVKTTLTMDEDGATPVVGDIITYTGTAANAKATVHTPKAPAAYNDETKAVGTYVAATDAVLFAEVTGYGIGHAEASYKAYTLRDLKDTGLTSVYAVTKSNKVVAAWVDLGVKPSGATDKKAYGIVSGYTGIVEVEADKEYAVYTIVNDAESYTVKIDRTNAGAGLATGTLVEFEPSKDSTYANVGLFTVNTNAVYVEEYNETDDTLTYFTSVTQVNNAYEATGARSVYALADDVKFVYVDQDGNKAGEVIGVNAFDAVTGWKNAAISVDPATNEIVAIFVETSNKCHIVNVTPASLAADLAAAGPGEVVTLSNDVAATDALVLNGATLDGNGNTITVENEANDTTNYGINATGGTISNMKIEGSSYEYNSETYGFRAIMVSGSLTDDLVIDNVDASGATYGINISNGAGNDLIVTDSSLGDWNSFSGVANASFTGCTFTSDGVATANLRVYNATATLTDCEFEVTSGQSQYKFDNHDSYAGTIYLVNCTVNGEAVTTSNFATYFVTDHNTVYVDGVQVAP